MFTKQEEASAKRDTVMVPTGYGIRLELYWEGKFVYTTRCKTVEEANKRAEEFWKREKYQ